MTQKIQDFKNWLDENSSRKEGIEDKKWEKFFSRYKRLLERDWKNKKNGPEDFKEAVRSEEEKKVVDIFFEWLKEIGEWSEESRLSKSWNSQTLAVSSRLQEESSRQISNENESNKVLKKWLLVLFPIVICLSAVGFATYYNTEDSLTLKRSELNKNPSQYFENHCDFISKDKGELTQCGRFYEELLKNRKKKKLLGEQIREKEKELEQLKNDLKIRLVDGPKIEALETILAIISQEQISRLVRPQIAARNEKQLNEAKKKIGEALSKEEIENVCRQQVELERLELELAGYQNREIVKKKLDDDAEKANY